MMPEITAKRIEWALWRVAVAIKKAGEDGPGYAPIFLRLERELVIAQEREAAMARALKLADEKEPPHETR